MMAKSKVIVAVSAFCGVLALGAGLIAQQQQTGSVVDRPGDIVPVNPSVMGLIEARVGVAKEVFEAMMATPQHASLDDMTAWSRRWMEDQTSLAAEPARRLAAIQDHLGRLKRLEGIAAERKEAARGTHAEALQVKYFRLEAEQMIAEMRIMNPGLFAPKPAARR